MNNLKKILIFLFLPFYSFIFSQNTSIKGFIYDKDSGEPLSFVNVFIESTNYGASTNYEGYFVITNIPTGKYNIKVVYLGYKTIEEEIEIFSNNIFSKNYYLEQDATILSEIEISTEKEEQKNEVNTAIIKISPIQIRELPSIGSEPDIAQYLQVLPGVNFTGDQGGQLYIRGGANYQNLVLLDGLVIYNPFHSIGLFSVFDSDIIRSADVYTGGFNSEYGGRVSSVMDLKIRNGNINNFGGKVSMSTFGGKLMLEGPIIKQTKKGASLSFITSAKTSYLEQSSKIFYPYLNDSKGLPYSYNDFYGKLSLNTAGGSKFDVFGFSFNDKVNYTEMPSINWLAYGLGANFIIVPPSSTSIIKSTIAFSNYKIGMDDINVGKESTSSILGFNISFDFISFFGKNQLDWGLSALGFNTNYTYYNFLGYEYVQDENTTELAAFIKYKWHLGSFILEPGFRIQHYASLNTPSFEPRLGVKWNITEKIRFKASAGLYSQNIVAANNDKDVVNLFYGFLSGNLTLQSHYKGEEITNKLQKSQHIISGFEFDITKNLNFQVEGYLKNFSQIITVNRNKIFEDNSQNYQRPDSIKKDFLMETGYAYGVDFWAKYSTKKIYLWFVYSLGWVKRDDGKKIYEPIHDRRHNVNFVVTYKFGNKLSWNVSARWNIASGFPFTQIQGYYELPDFYQNIDYNYWSNNDALGTIYSDYNKGRLPYYHRLDLTINKTFQFKKKMKLEINFSIINVYNRKNLFYFEGITNKRVNQLPILPSLGINFSF